MSFIQDSSLLLGEREDIESLASKSSARVLVVSDSHGAYESFIAILKQFGSTCDALIFCGDGICDLAKIIEKTIKEPDFKQFIPSVIGIVQGNNDADIYPVRNTISSEPYFIELKVPLFNIMEVCGHRIFWTHGHRSSLYLGTEQIESCAQKNKCEIALYGHTHIATENFGQVYTLNPGSCSRPRCGQKPSFATITLSKDKSSIESIFYELGFQKSSPFFPDRNFKCH